MGINKGYAILKRGCSKKPKLVAESDEYGDFPCSYKVNSTTVSKAACRAGYATLFCRMNTQIEQTVLARAKGTYLSLIRRLTAPALLILDDFGMKPLLPQLYGRGWTVDLSGNGPDWAE